MSNSGDTLRGPPFSGDPTQRWRSEGSPVDVPLPDSEGTQRGLGPESPPATNAGAPAPAPANTTENMVDAPAIGARYQPRQLIGRGGMSEVFRVHDRARNEDVALKILNPGFPVTTLGSEFRFITSLGHPGVVAVYDFGLTTDGRPYYTMELVSGGNLLAYARTAELRPTIEAVKAAFETLAFVHTRGIVHGDLKPSNMLMAASHRGHRYPKLLDFGIAWEVDQPESGLGGTIHYVAPETIVRKPSDHRADLYAMGVVLYRVLTAELPFRASDPRSVLRQHLKQPAPDPRDSRSSVPGELAEIVLRLLEKAPEDRFQSAHQVVVALDGWLGAAPFGTKRTKRKRRGRRQGASGKKTQSAVVLESDAEADRWVAAIPEVQLAGASRFVARQAELMALLTPIAASIPPRSVRSQRPWSLPLPAEDDGPWLFLVTGESGIGKTRLLQELRIRVQLEAVACLNVDFAGASSSADCLRRLAMTIAASAGDASLLEREMARLVKSTFSAEGDEGQEAGEPSWQELDVPLGERLIVVAERLAATCTELAASKPLMVSLDSLEAVHPEVVPALRAFAAGVVQASILVVAAGAKDSVGIRDLHTIAGSQLIEPNHLERAQTELVIRSLLGEIDDEQAAEIVEQVHNESGGNPGAIERVVRALVATGAVVRSGGVYRVAAQLAGGLPRQTADAGLHQIAKATLFPLAAVEREVSEIAAYIGEPFDTELLLAVAIAAEVIEGDQRDRDDHWQAVLRNLTDRRVIEPDSATSDDSQPARYRFVQRTVRDVLRQSVSAAQAIGFSRQIVVALQRQLAAGSLDEPALRARHLQVCKLPAEAAEAAALAIREAMQSGVSVKEQTVGILDDVLVADLATTGDRYLTQQRWGELAITLGDLNRRRGELSKAIEWYERVARAAQANANEHGRGIQLLSAMANRKLGDLLLEQGDGAGERLLRVALNQARVLNDEPLVGRAAYTLSHHLVLAGRHDEAARGIDEALEVAGQLGDPPLLARVLKLRATLNWYRGNLAQAETDARAAAAEYRALGSLRGAAVSLGALGNALYSRRQLADAERIYADALRHARTAAWLTGIGKLENCLATVAFHTADWDRACEHWRAALTVTERTGNRVERALILNNFGFVAAARGEDDAAASLYVEALETARDAGFTRGEALVLGNLGELYSSLGELDRAREQLEACLAIAQRIDATGEQVECEVRLLETDLASNVDPVEVLGAAQKLLARAERADVTAELPRIRRVVGEALARIGEARRAEQQFVEAFHGFDELGADYEAARVIRLAATLASEQLLATDGLAERLSEARRLFRRLRAQPELDLARQASSELERAKTDRPSTMPAEVDPYGNTADLKKALGSAPAPDRSGDAEPSEPELLSLLVEVSRQISSILDLDELLEHIVDTALALTQTERGFVIVCDGDGNPNIRVNRGLNETEAVGGQPEGEPSHSIIKRVMASRQPLSFHDLSSPAARFLGDSVVRLGLQAIVCYPLLWADHLVGLLYLDSRRSGYELSPLRLRVLEAMSAQAAIAIENARLFERQKRKSELLATAIHELLHPLSAISGYASRVREEVAQSDSAALEHAAVLHEQSKRVTRMAAALFDTATTEADELSWPMVSIQMKDLIETATLQARHVAEMNGVRLNVRAAAGLPTIFGNRDRLIQAVASLLTTAIHASPEDAAVMLRVRVVRQDRRLGYALPALPEKRESIMPTQGAPFELSDEQLVQLDIIKEEKPGFVPPPIESVSSPHPENAPGIELSLALGYGDSRMALGFTIIREIVHYHRGRIWAEAAPGGGTCFSIVLPSLVAKAPANVAS